MQKIKLISHARKIEALFNAYLEVIFGARQDTLRIVSSLEAVVLNVDLLIVAGFPGEAREDLEPMATHVLTLTATALSAAKNTLAMIQANIPKAQEGAAKTTGLVMRLTRGQVAAGEGYDSLCLALNEIKKVVLQVEEDAVRCVAAVRALQPQVETLQNRVLALLPWPQKGDGQKAKKTGAGRKPGGSLSLVESIH